MFVTMQNPPFSLLYKRHSNIILNSQDPFQETHFNENEENVLYNNNLMRVRFKDHINSDFILYQFSSPYLITQLNKIKSGTTNVAAIYYKSLKNISLLINTVDNQQKLVNYFNKVSKQSQTTQLKLKDQLKYLKNLKSSILSKAFSGEL